jgi:hypothetical protein
MKSKALKKFLCRKHLLIPAIKELICGQLKGHHGDCYDPVYREVFRAPRSRKEPK